MEEKKISCVLTNSRMEPLHIEEALSLLDRVHLLAFQNEEDGSYNMQLKESLTWLKALLFV